MRLTCCPLLQTRSIGRASTPRAAAYRVSTHQNTLHLATLAVAAGASQLGMSIDWVVLLGVEQRYESQAVM